MTSTSINNNPTPAQEEFQSFIDNNTDKGSRVHPEDRDDHDSDHSEQDEEDRYRNAQIEEAMRAPVIRSGDITLPPASFDSGRATGVKGVIADARAYEQARQGKWRNKVSAVRRSVMGLSMTDRPNGTNVSSPADSEDDVDSDEEAFLQQWREARRLELEAEAKSKNVRSRRTSPSPRMFGRFDTVDALGYLDAIEKVGRDTTVVVFVYDHECQVSGMMESALRPLVSAYPYIHFVKVHYEDIEFDNAAVPTILGYRNQGDLFANLTGIIDMIPEDEDFDTDSLKKVLQRSAVL
ncbi:thioredoxin-like protein [Xylaria bambusicola]|uniref:thioredoxin-like protein n=1 Tax=Xylaria bambusicola TaxID=326684 RepID=UPI00200767AB|nr:thioredoxin-like protein [Xylaria bambusicola]KAI0512770.1 thioredoxin-like protein [Xylaria bambusicola]